MGCSTVHTYPRNRQSECAQIAIGNKRLQSKLYKFLNLLFSLLCQEAITPKPLTNHYKTVSTDNLGCPNYKATKVIPILFDLSISKSPVEKTIDSTYPSLTPPLSTMFQY